MNYSMTPSEVIYGATAEPNSTTTLEVDLSQVTGNYYVTIIGPYDWIKVLSVWFE